MNSKNILGVFGKNRFLVETIKGTGLLKGWPKGASVMGSAYFRKATLE